MKIYLHIGEGKCASSTIQSFLSYREATSDFAYTCLKANGSIIKGKEISILAKASPVDYINSALLINTAIDYNFLSNLKSSLSDLAKNHKSILLSNEGWSNIPGIFASMAEVFLDYDVEVIMIIRPPVSWINSAWWQWGNWLESIGGVDEYVETNKNIAQKWLQSINQFQSFNFVRKVYVLSLSKDIMKDFFSLIGLENEIVNTEKNASSSQELLTFMTKNRALRETEHSPEKEFILNKYLKKRTPSNWVLSDNNISSVLHSTKDYCLLLATLISNEDIINNPEWWDKSAYQDKNLNRTYEIKFDVLSDMLLEAYETIIELDRKLLNYNVLTKYLRDEAIKVENENIKLAYELMLRAKNFRPNGPMINKKLNEYEIALKNLEK